MIQEYDPEDSPYSFGTTPIYNTLFKMLTDKEDETDTVMINLSTIVRNAASKPRLQEEYKEAKEKSFPFDVLAGDIVRETVTEAKLLVDDIIQMMKSKPSPLPRYIYMYLGDYSKAIPKQYLREATAGKQHIDMAETNLKAVYKSNRTESDRDGVKVIEIYNCTTHVLPFRWLEKEIRYIKNKHNVVMISSHPLDYHISRYVAQWTHIKSFNGYTQSAQQIGPHIFGYDFLPFTEKLHILLGDKTDLKPCISMKSKRDLLTRASADNWHLKSKDYTDRVLNSLNFITPYTI